MSDRSDGALRAAIIGCGTIAYDHLPFLARSKRAQVVGLCDRSHAMAEALRNHFELDAPIYSDVSMMLSEQRPDIVHVLTPPQTHDPIVRQAFAANAHVICEKPMTGTARETEALLDAASRADRVLVESRNMLFNDPILEALEMVRQGKIGEVRECDIILSVDFLAGPFGDPNLVGPGAEIPGGAIHDFLPHLVYTFQAFTGAETATEVLGELTNRSGNARAGYDFLDALIRAGDVRGRMRIATDVEPSAFRISLRGSVGSLETDVYNPFMHLEGPPNTNKRFPLGQMRTGLGLIGAGFRNLSHKIAQHRPSHGLPRMIEAVYDAILDDKPLPITPEQILATARMTDQIIALGRDS